MSSTLADRWSVIVVGGRIAGAAAAMALAPYADEILILERSGSGTFWPQQASWDRKANLLWHELGLLESVLRCGAPRILAHTFRTLDTDVEYDYPQDDEHCYRMSVAREDLDPALARAAVAQGNVTLARPAKVTDVLTEGGRVAGVEFVYDGSVRQARCGLVVFADGRLSANADRIGAVPYLSQPSAWLALLYYCDGLALTADHGYYSKQPGAMVVVAPCGVSSWCVSASIHRDRIERAGVSAVRVFTEVVGTDPLVGAAVARARCISPIGGAGKMRLLRRPMAGPGWCLVGDCGYFLDPLTALGTRAALTTVRLLRDRVADAGSVTARGLHQGLTAERDRLLEPEWARTVSAIGRSSVLPGELARARMLATDPDAALAAVRSQMGLKPRAAVAMAAGSRED